MRLFAGTDTIETAVHGSLRAVQPRRVRPAAETATGRAVCRSRFAHLRRAQAIFDEEVGKSFSLDLRDLSRDNWSLLPQAGDFLAEVRTRRFDTLTFARALTAAGGRHAVSSRAATQHRVVRLGDEVEQPRTLLQRRRPRRVRRARLRHSTPAFSPERRWLDGQARIRLRVKAYALAALTLRLADDFNVSSITSDKLGRLMFLRVRNQNNVVVNLPSPVARDVELTLTIGYAGPVRPQSIEEESVTSAAGRRPSGQRVDELPFIPPEPNWLFSNRSHWYPQNQVTDYATSTIRFNVPSRYKVVASAVELVESPVTTVVDPAGTPVRVTYLFKGTNRCATLAPSSAGSRGSSGRPSRVDVASNAQHRHAGRRGQPAAAGPRARHRADRR